MTAELRVDSTMRWKPRFFSIWAGQAFSLLGSMLVQFALVWWLTQETGSATVLAMATLVAVLPAIFLGPVAGTLVDRWNRRLVMIVADSLTALATLMLILLYRAGALEVWHVYLADGVPFADGRVSISGHAGVYLADGARGATDPRGRVESDAARGHEHHLAAAGRAPDGDHAAGPGADGGYPHGGVRDLAAADLHHTATGRRARRSKRLPAPRCGWKCAPAGATSLAGAGFSPS